MKVLVVEDEVRLADYLHKGLSEGGYVVDVARDGIDGAHFATEGSYDLVILDGNPLEDRDDPTVMVRAALRSLVMRAAECAALRLIVHARLARTRAVDSPSRSKPAPMLPTLAGAKAWAMRAGVASSPSSSMAGILR